VSDLKRDQIKYIRDISKNAYKKANNCFICSATTDLDFHHRYSMTALWNAWKKKNNIIITCVDDILEHRLVFKEEHHKNIYDDTLTLCHEHHLKLHKIYGKTPPLYSAEKQLRWVIKQKDKLKSEKV